MSDPEQQAPEQQEVPEPTPLVTDLRTGTEVHPSVVAHHAAFLQGAPYYKDPNVTPPLPPPTITALNPATGPAATDITIAIAGSGFDVGPTVNIAMAHSLVPTSITPTDLTVLFSGTAHIQFPGVLAVSVTNGDGQTSNALDFTVT